VVYDDYGTIGGGGGNRAGSDDGNPTTAPYATVGGGRENKASLAYATVGGGYNNTASHYATVGGGHHNIANGPGATVGGGYSNTASDSDATVGGGYKNTASGVSATVGGGKENTASDYYATVPGGYKNTADGYVSFAAGYKASATHDNAFVWSGGGGSSTSSWGSNTFTVRCHGGARFYSASGTSTGVQLSSGGTSWSSISDRKTKENFADVDNARLLEALAAMPIQTWNLKSQSPKIRHIGPVAQDFNGIFGYLFGEVESPTHINSMDAIGVSLAAAQGLYQLSKEQAARIEELEEENAALREQLDDLEARVAALEKGAETGAWRFLEASILGGWSLPVTLLSGISLAFLAQRKRRVD
jgi:hypothetical protein